MPSHLNASTRQSLQAEGPFRIPLHAHGLQSFFWRENADVGLDAGEGEKVFKMFNFRDPNVSLAGILEKIIRAISRMRNERER